MFGRAGQHLLTGFCFVYGNLTGLLTVYYDARRQRMVSSRWLGRYALANNACMLLMMCAFLYESFRPEELYKTNPRTQDTRRLYALLIAASSSYIMLSRCQRQRQLRRVVDALQRLQCSTFYCYAARQLDAGVQRHLQRLLYTKVALVLCHSLLMIVPQLPTLLTRRWYDRAFVLFLLNLVNMFHGAVLQFFLCLWHICHRYAVINARLRCLAAGGWQRLFAARVSRELWSLHLAHAQLSRLVWLLCDAYKLLILSTQLIYFGSNVSSGYLLVVILNKGLNVTFENMFMAGSLYLLLLLDMYVFNSISEYACGVREQTARILQQFSDMPQAVAGTAERHCNWFALQLSWRRMRISIFDGIVINREQSFYVASQILFFTIVLVQGDYKNIWVRRVHVEAHTKAPAIAGAS